MNADQNWYKRDGRTHEKTASDGRSREESDDDWLETIEELLKDEGIKLPSYEPGTQRILCPKCDGGSTSEISLSVTIDPVVQCALYHCFRAKCEWGGIVRAAANDGMRLVMTTQGDEKLKKPDVHFEELDDECYQFFKNRGISSEVVDRNGIMMEMKMGRKFLAFPYKVDGEIVNVKYRGLTKKEFHQVSGAVKVLYGLDDIKDDLEEVIIVEGELDKLALEEAGFKNVLSVPDGAPGKVKEGPPSPEDRKFSYLQHSQKLFDRLEKVVLATDGDDSGEALAEELARRLGYWKCYKVKWPKNFDDAIVPRDVEFDESEREDATRWRRKDANEVLMKDSSEVLKAYIDHQQPYPVAGLFQFVDYYDEIRDHYIMKMMCPSGYTTGWPGLDEFYRVVPGELSVVSGVPNSGKSEWLDALAVHLAEIHGWSIAFASMEKHAWDHGRMLIEKHVRKPFFENVYYAKGEERMDPEEVQQGITWINDRFPLIIRTDESLTTIDWILEKARLAVFRFGIRGLVIDPYNELDHGRLTRQSETEFVSEMLTKIKRFACKYQVHVWLVAHPRQMHNWTGEPPNLYDISGSAHFINKADAGIVIHRNWRKVRDTMDGKGSDAEVDEEAQLLVRIMILKMRNKAAGRVGECVLKYNPVHGTYADLNEEELAKRSQEHKK